jgi:Zn-dependent protease/CBS domain-containing protein
MVIYRREEADLLGGGFRIARVFGINIFMDPSWIFIFLLVTWNLSGVIFPSIHPDWSTQLNIGLGILASSLFFGSVLAHELSHSLMARAKGLPVGRITLFIFGGAADIGREPPSPVSEFLIAIIGPITSAVLGILFLVFGALSMNGFGAAVDLSGGFQSLTPLATMFFWLGPINILLAVFNMVPGFPLDGGRVLRSILWKISKNLRWATRWATITGQFIAWLFIATGIAMVIGLEVPVFGSGLIGGLWLAFIGWFLNNAAVQSYRQVVVEDMLRGVTVQRLLRPDVPVIDPDLLLQDLTNLYNLDRDEHTFAVLRAGRLIGMLPLQEVHTIPQDRWGVTHVREIMTPLQELQLITPLDEATEAYNKLVRAGVRQLPVVEEDGNFVGVLRRRDILRWLKLQSELVES